MNTAQEYAKKIELTHMWLDVMASATTARSAYCKWGFSEMGCKKFSRRVKEDLSEMVVMGLKLNAKDL
ncbi:hypothetical protein JY479_18030 [Serratia marcescens]|nr:hypothetical protein [Serratia marcescens]